MEIPFMEYKNDCVEGWLPKIHFVHLGINELKNKGYEQDS